MNVKFDLCYLKTNRSTKFQGNISKKRLRKYRKLSGRIPRGLAGRRTDILTDRRRAYSPSGFTARGLINSMDNMPISGIEPSSVITEPPSQNISDPLPNNVLLKSKCDAKLMTKQVEAEKDGVMSPQNNNLNKF